MIDKRSPVIILCGGKGTRIADLAEHIPKPMVLIGGKPILWHIMKIYATYGFKNFILTLGHKGWAIKDYFLNYQFKNADLRIDFDNREKTISVISEEEPIDWQVTLAETGEDTLTGKRVALCEKYVDTDHFMVTYGDGVGNIRIDELVQFHLEKDKIGTVTSVRPTSRFGNIVLDGKGCVTEFNEKTDAGGGTINGGFFVFKKAFFDILRQSDNVMLERDPMDRLVEMGQLTAFRHEGFWEPMDTTREYRMLNELWDSGQAHWKIW